VDRIGGIARWERIDGPTVVSSIGEVTPEARALVVRFPFGGIVWTKPVAVRIERAGSTERIPIPDPTRRAQIGFIAAIVVVFLLTLLTAGKRSRSNESNE
jgi:hypothetical protein